MLMKPLTQPGQDWWEPGWYLLHVGGGALPQAVAQKLAELSIEDMPLETDLPKGIVGAVKLDRVCNSADVDHALCFPDFGGSCYSIVAAKDFGKGIPAQGKPGRWLLQENNEVQQLLENTAEATFNDILPDSARKMGPKKKDAKRKGHPYFEWPATQRHKGVVTRSAPTRTRAPSCNAAGPQRSSNAGAEAKPLPAEPAESNGVLVADNAAVAANAAVPSQQESQAAEEDDAAVPSDKEGQAVEVVVPPTQPSVEDDAERQGFGDERLGFFFRGARAQATLNIPDPLREILERLKACESSQSFRSQTVPQQLFSGLTEIETVYHTITKWLTEIYDDERDNNSVAADPGFSLKLLAPVPIRVAVQTISLREAWPAEALLLAVQSNLGWLERPHCRLLEVAEDKQVRSPNIPFFVGLQPSMRKTSLKDRQLRC